ncbi:MAG: heliorhodopsin HeR [Patescibacteria group bacterium]
MAEISTSEQQWLRRWNLGMGFLHLIQGLIMLFLSKTQTFTLVLNLPKPNPAIRSVTLQPEKWLEINLGWAIASFLLLSAVAHFITLIPAINKWYVNNLSKQMNLIRWWEYALSSSLMVVVIAALCGINDGSIMILLFVVNACMNLFGAVMEKHNSALKQLATQLKESYKTDWTAFVYGSIAGAAPWVVMGIYFFTAVNRVNEFFKIPDFVYWIFPTLFVFFNLFAINMFLQYKGVGPWKNYTFGEKAYIFLSLAAKSTLAWIIWGGTLRP